MGNGHEFAQLPPPLPRFRPAVSPTADTPAKLADAPANPTDAPPPATDPSALYDDTPPTPVDHASATADTPATPHKMSALSAGASAERAMERKDCASTHSIGTIVWVEPSPFGDTPVRSTITADRTCVANCADAEPASRHPCAIA